MKSQMRSLVALSFSVIIGLTTSTFAQGQQRNTATGDSVRYNGGSHGPERNDTSGSERRNTATGDNVRYNGGSHGPERNDTSGSQRRSNERPDTATGDNVRYNGGSHGPERNDTSGSERPDATERQQAQRSTKRNSWEGLYDQTSPDRNVGNLILGREERLLYLQNGDRILLPTQELWQGNAQIQVNRVYDMPLHYQVTITTRSDKSLDELIQGSIIRNGVEYAARNGLMTPQAILTHIGRRIIMAAIKPQPLNEGETVYWRIPSAYNGIVDVQIINLKK